MDVIVQCALCESTCDRRKAHHYHELDFESIVFVKKEVVENELANKYGPRTLSDALAGNRADYNSPMVTDNGGSVKILSKSGSKGNKTGTSSCIFATEDLYRPRTVLTHHSCYGSSPRSG